MLDNINEELYKIKQYIEKKEYKKAIFESNKIKMAVISEFLKSKDISLIKENQILREFEKQFKENQEVLNIYYAIDEILRKYDFYYQDVFNKDDAERMYFGIIKLIEIYNSTIENKEE